MNMDIGPEQIASKALVGWEGADPVFEVESKGGRNWVVSVHDGKVVPRGVGPHRAIARFLAKKLHPGIRWTGLAKSDPPVDPGSRIVALYERITRALG